MQKITLCGGRLESRWQRLLEWKAKRHDKKCLFCSWRFEKPNEYKNYWINKIEIQVENRVEPKLAKVKIVFDSNKKIAGFVTCLEGLENLKTTIDKILLDNK